LLKSTKQFPLPKFAIDIDIPAVSRASPLLAERLIHYWADAKSGTDAKGSVNGVAALCSTTGIGTFVIERQHASLRHRVHLCICVDINAIGEHINGVDSDGVCSADSCGQRGISEAVCSTFDCARASGGGCAAALDRAARADSALPHHVLAGRFGS
jgi:hypothetical protein